jgi:hypothetical protein
VPAGTKDVGAGITLTGNVSDQLEAFLINPNEEIQAVDTNLYATSLTTTGPLGKTVQLTSATPVAGRWRLVVNVINPVDGTVVNEPFTGTVNLNAASVTAPGVPNSASTVLPRGKATTAQVTVKNTGIAPIRVQIDPRTGAPVQMPLVSPFGSQNFTLPGHSTVPTFVVPPGSTGVTAVASASAPVIAELLQGFQGVNGVGDLEQAKDGSTISVAKVSEKTGTVATGIWYTDADEVGPVGASGQPTVNGHMDAYATTPAFDPAVTSSTGDFWGLATNPTADLGSPVTIQPGQSATITVTITPTAAVGTKVTGVLNVIVPPSFAYATFNTTGETLAQLPYSYTVGAATPAAHQEQGAPKKN